MGVNVMIKRFMQKRFPRLVSLTLAFAARYDMELDQVILQRQLQHSNPLVRFGKKCFSQTDEDGITFEVIKRLGITNGTFAEFGVGDGTENNTLALLALGWKGFWVGGEDLAFDTSRSKVLTYYKQWITRDNIFRCFAEGMRSMDAQKVDLISLDVDGNDLYFCEELLKNGACPSLFITEYNAKFPPPIRFTIRYNDEHFWRHDDYHGASLMSFVDLFERYGYRLICCNAASGSNSFFVREEDVSKFPEVPNDVEDIYTPPHFFLYTRHGHRQSLKTVDVLLQNDVSV
jgi:hypothetical protein